MAESEHDPQQGGGGAAPPAPPEEEIPRLQQLFDSPFVLLVLCLVIFFAFYTIWGTVEIMTLPDAPLP